MIKNISLKLTSLWRNSSDANRFKHSKRGSALRVRLTNLIKVQWISTRCCHLPRKSSRIIVAVRTSVFEPAEVRCDAAAQFLQTPTLKTRRSGWLPCRAGCLPSGRVPCTALHPHLRNQYLRGAGYRCRQIAPPWNSLMRGQPRRLARRVIRIPARWCDRKRSAKSIVWTHTLIRTQRTLSVRVCDAVYATACQRVLKLAGGK